MQTRLAGPDDAALLTANVREGFQSYREWAPQGWLPPSFGAAAEARLAARLEREDVWCLLASDAGEAAGHVALSPFTIEDPEPAPPGETNLWQMFVRERWRGSGLASSLMAAALTEAGARGLERLRLWTPQGAGRARRFYEREAWSATGRVNERSPSGLATVEYQRALAR